MTVHHEVAGPAGAPPLLLAGSLGTTLRMWDPLLGPLAQRATLRTIAYDQLGHGASPAPPGPYSIARLGEAAIALLDHLEIERASFAGVSIGGMIGQWLAAHAPDRIDKLVLICTSAHLPPAQAWHDRARTVTEAGTVDVIADAVVDRWLTPPFATAHPDVRAGLRAALAAQPPAGYAACCAAIAAMDQRKDLASIAAPTLVVGGAQDHAIANEHQRALAAAIPGATLQILDPGAHVVPVEQPDAVAQLIADHLEGTMSDELHDAGMEVRRAVLGDAHVDRAVANTTDFSRPFQELITNMAWGSVWTRDGLGRRERSMVTLAVLTTLRAEDELAMHVRAALRNGLTAEEIREVLLHTAVYAGVPQANSAIATAQEVLREEGVIE